jgi:AcrR family transcriptional regulator
MPNSMPGRILDAALSLFALHGFQRTSMADIAAAAGVSRASLYLHFKDKTALFGSLAAAMADRALAAAEAAWDERASFSDNLAATVLARDLPLHRLLHASPHGADLLRVDAALTSAHAARLEAGFERMVTRRAEAAGADLSVFGGAEGLAAFLSLTAAGLKHESRAEDAYVASIRRLAAVIARAAG